MSKGFDLGGILQQAQQLQERLANVQNELAGRTVEASAGGGMVTATVNGKLEVIAIKIDKSRVDTGDTEMLEDLIVAAIRAAQTKSAQEMQAEMSKMTAGMGLPPGMLPGM